MSSAPPSVQLNAANLQRLRAGVQIPRYDRAALKRGMVHIGVGGFHRSHQAVYLDDLLQTPGSEDYGLCGIGLMPHDGRIGNVLREQDYLYTVVARSSAGDEARVIGSIIDFLFAPDDAEAVIERLASPETQVVSLTITEAGYCIHQTTRKLDEHHPSIVHDLEHPQQPIGTFGFLAEALHRRRLRGQGPFTVMSCDNLLNNGDVCRHTLLAFLQLRDPALAAWVEQQGAFPNSMVDRITPATTDEHRALLHNRFGIHDAWPVITEPFRQWIIEDQFAQGRPQWERVGAQVVTDIEPYEKMKIRLLNGGHQVMCYISLLLGYRFAPQAIGDVQIHTLLQRFMDHEVTPLLPPVPGIDLEDYKQTLRTRFANPAANDQLFRISTDGSARIAEFLLPTLAEQLRRNGPIHIGAFAVAAWFRHLSGEDDHGGALQIVDPIAAALREQARLGGADPSALLSIGEVFSGELVGSRTFVDEVTDYLKRFYEQGARAALTHCIERTNRY